MSTGVTASSDYSSPVISGKLESKDIGESSGLAASACRPDVLWTHNDAGDEAYIFALTSAGGHLGTWKVQNAENVDWEDIAIFKDAAGKCFIYIADIGNNELDRSQLTIYRIPEPLVSSAAARSSSSSPGLAGPGEALEFRYSSAPSNAETMIVHPRTADIYILTKRENGPSEIHKLKPVFGIGSTAVTQKVGEISVPSIPVGLLTGGTVSPDGSRVMLCDYQKGYELVLPAGTEDFDAIWKQKPLVVDLGKRRQGEGITYSPDGNTVYASSEKQGSPLIKISRR